MRPAVFAPAPWMQLYNCKSSTIEGNFTAPPGAILLKKAFVAKAKAFSWRSGRDLKLKILKMR